jgi:hypothetical protein
MLLLLEKTLTLTYYKIILNTSAFSKFKFSYSQKGGVSEHCEFPEALLPLNNTQKHRTTERACGWIWSQEGLKEEQGED